jgi:hypothetical protein
MYGVDKVQMPLPGHRVNAGTLKQNVVPTQKDKPLLSSKRRPHFQTHERSWKEYKLGHGSRQGLKPRTGVLVRASSSLLDWTGLKLGI